VLQKHSIEKEILYKIKNLKDIKFMTLLLPLFYDNLGSMEKEEKTNESGMTVYEVSYLLLPSLAIEQVPGEVENIKNSIKSAGGEVVSGEEPILIDLAYTMTKVVQTNRYKCDNAYFGWTKFELTPEGIEEVKKTLDLNDNILRYLLIKTVKDNTLINGKMMLKKEESKKDYLVEEGVVGESTEDSSSEEEIDKSIEDLVIS